MILVPLLVGMTILMVAATTRRQVLRELDELARRERLSGPPLSPLCEAFPHLQLWVPQADAIYRATHATSGSKGPDIVFRRTRPREFSDAA
jgi:hypothetical protein